MWRGLYALLAALCLLAFSNLSACGHGDTGPVKGRAFKGPISGAAISIFRLNEDASRGDLLANLSADSRGFFYIDKSFDFPVLMVSTGGTFIWEATGEILQMDEGLELLAMYPLIQKGWFAAVTAFTHIATFQVQTRLTMGQSLPDAIDSANRDIAARFGIPEVDLIHTLPMDLTDPAEAGNTGAYDPTPIDKNLNIQVENTCSSSCLYGLAHAALAMSISDLFSREPWRRGPAYASTSESVGAAQILSSLSDLGKLAAAAIDGRPITGYGITNPGMVDIYTTFGAQTNGFLGSPWNQSKIPPGGVVLAPSTGQTGTLPPPPVPPPAAPIPPASAPVITSVSTCGPNGNIFWQTVAGATSYAIYFSNNPASAAPGAVGRQTAYSSGGTVTGLANGVTYYAVVVAVNSGGEGPPSRMVSFTPSVGLVGFQLCLAQTIAYFNAVPTGPFVINCPKMGITNLVGIDQLNSYARNPVITDINLSGNKLTDITPLALLKPKSLMFVGQPLFQKIDLSNNQITNITPLASYEQYMLTNRFGTHGINVRNNQITAGMGGLMTTLGATRYSLPGPFFGSPQNVGLDFTGNTTALPGGGTGPSIACVDMTPYVASPTTNTVNPVPWPATPGVDCF